MDDGFCHQQPLTPRTIIKLIQQTVFGSSDDKENTRPQAHSNSKTTGSSFLPSNMLDGPFSQKAHKSAYVGRDKVVFTEARAVNKAQLHKTISTIFRGMETFSGNVSGNHLSVQTGFRRWLNELIDNLQSIDDPEARTNALDIIIPVAENDRYKTSLEWAPSSSGDFPLPRKTVPFRRLPHADDNPPELFTLLAAVTSRFLRKTKGPARNTAGTNTDFVFICCF